MALETFLIGSYSSLVLGFASTSGIVVATSGIVDCLVVLESKERPDKNLGWLTLASSAVPQIQEG